MKDKARKIISILATATLLTSTLAFVSCGDESYKGNKLDGYVSSENTAVSNGGFAVQKDDFVYYLTGAEDYAVSNTYGKVKKGALMRIANADLQKGDYEKAQTVVPMLLVSQDYDSGFYIYGDYVYFATPTTDKDVESGQVQSGYIDFKRAKLDGSWTMKGKYFHLEDRASNFRFVEEGEGADKTVYCLYEENGALKSFNTKTEKTNVLVEGATELIYDMQDLSNGTVYYTMGVKYNVDSKNPTDAPYNQVYKVNASATATATKNGYKTSNGREYTFDTDYLEKNEKGFDKGDYKTYPYVNLGELVLDGIGKNYEDKISQGYNDKKEVAGESDEISGYTYDLDRYAQDGVYFTRTVVNDTPPVKALYYLSDSVIDADGWKSVSGNAQVQTAAKNSSVFANGAVFIGEDFDDYVYYAKDDKILFKVQDGEEFAMAYGVADITLWTVDGNYLYYYTSGGNGYKLSRINCTGAKADYFVPTEEYEPIDFNYVDFNSDWYKPEFFEGKLLYSGAQSLGLNAYRYIYATDVPATNAELKALNEKYDEVNTYISDFEDDKMEEALTYVFHTGEKSLLDDVQKLYDTIHINEYTAFAAHGKSENESKTDYAAKFVDAENKHYDRMNYYIGLMGGKDAIKSADIDAIEESWAGTLQQETVVATDDSFPVWAIVLIVIGGVLVVGAAIGVPVALHLKKKAQLQAAYERTRVRKDRLDTTDDKSIDVYANEEETPAEAEKTDDTSADETETVEENKAEESAKESVETEDANVVSEEATAPAEEERKEE